MGSEGIGGADIGAAAGEVGERFVYGLAGGGVEGLVEFFVVGEGVDAFDEVVDAVGCGLVGIDGGDGLVAEGFVGGFKPGDGDVACEFVFAHVGFDAFDGLGGGDTDADGDIGDGDDRPAAIAGEGFAGEGDNGYFFADPHFDDGACVESDERGGDHVAAWGEGFLDLDGVDDVTDGIGGVGGDLADLAAGFEEGEGDAAEEFEVVGSACFFQGFFAVGDRVEVVGFGEGSRCFFHEGIDRVVAGVRTHRGPSFNRVSACRASSRRSLRVL